MVEIVIFVLPNELIHLNDTINRLYEGSRYLTLEQRKNIKLNVVMGISDEIIDWNKSIIKKSDIIDKFLKIKNLVDWTDNCIFETSTEISGCTSMRMESSKSDSDYYIWLDTDIIFDSFLLPNMLNSIKIVEGETSKFIITPEIVKQWDNTWDCLVNERFIDKEIGYQSKNNPYEDTFIKDGTTISLTKVRNNIIGQPYMKFAGGWFVLLSSKFLEKIPFPDGFTHYGYEDTYLMWGAHVLQDPNIIQYKLKNTIVCENYYDRNIISTDELVLIDRREDYKNHNQSLMKSGLQNLVR